MEARLGLGAIVRRLRQQKLTLEPVKLGLPPPLAALLGERQCLGDGALRRVGPAGPSIDVGQKREEVRPTQVGSGGAQVRQALLDRSCPCLEIPLRRHRPAMDDDPRRPILEERLFRRPRDRRLGLLLGESSFAAELVEKRKVAQSDERG